MTISAMRKQLMAYLESAEDSKIIGWYTLLEDAIKENVGVGLTPQQLAFLNEERYKYLNGEGKSYSIEESKELILKRKTS